LQQVLAAPCYVADLDSRVHQRDFALVKTRKSARRWLHSAHASSAAGRVHEVGWAAVAAEEAGAAGIVSRMRRV
jgi:hypothetical protein